MAIVTMKRLRLLAMGEDREALLDDLQRLGCVEVSEPTLDGQEESGAAELLSRLTPPDTQALSQAQTRRQEAERAMGVLKHYGAKGRGFLTPRPQTSKEELCSPQAATAWFTSPIRWYPPWKVAEATVTGGPVVNFTCSVSG